MSIKYSVPDSGQTAFCFCLLQRLMNQPLQQASFSGKSIYGVLIRKILKRYSQFYAVFHYLSIFNPHIQFFDFRNSDLL